MFYIIKKRFKIKIFSTILYIIILLILLKHLIKLYIINIHFNHNKKIII